MIPAIEVENPATERFFIWPDVTIQQTGLYGEAEADLSDRTLLKLGLRYDYAQVSADRAGIMPGGSMSAPNDFYTAQYGTTVDNTREEHNFSGLARIAHELAPGTTLFAGLSLSVRTADTTERVIARSNRVSNPDISPEKHQQLDLGITAVRNIWNASATVYVYKVEDFILRDAFPVPGVTTYRNVDARLAGLERNKR